MLPASIIFGCRGASFIHGLLHISAPWAPPGCLPSTLLRVAPLFRAEASGGSFPASLEIEFFSSRLFSTSIHDDISENIDEVARVRTGRASLKCGSLPARSSKRSSAVNCWAQERRLIGCYHFCYHFFQNCPVQRKTRWYRDCDLSPKTLTQ